MFFPAQTAPVIPRGGPQALGSAHTELAAQDRVQVGMQREQSSGDLSHPAHGQDPAQSRIPSAVVSSACVANLSAL